MKILVFGNELVKEDSLAVKLIPRLKEQFPDIEFKHIDPCENLEAEIEKGKLGILDVVQGIKKVIVIKDIEQIKQDKIYSMHDFDLAFNLKILHKVGKLREVEIIGIPQDIGEEDAFSQIQLILRKCVAQLIHGS